MTNFDEKFLDRKTQKIFWFVVFWSITEKLENQLCEKKTESVFLILPSAKNQF